MTKAIDKVLPRVMVGLLCFFSSIGLYAQYFQNFIGAEEEGWSSARVISVMTYPNDELLVHLQSEGTRSIIKLDVNGDPLWRRSVANGLRQMVPGVNGSAYLVYGFSSTIDSAGCVIVKLNAEGEDVWGKSYYLQEDNPWPAIDVRIYSRDAGGVDVFLVGDDLFSESSYLMRVDGDGNVQWTIGTPSTIAVFNYPPDPHVIHDGNDGIVVFYPFHDQSAGLISRFDAQGIHLWSTSVRMTNALWEYHPAAVTLTPEGAVYVCGSQTGGGGSYNYLFKLDQVGELQWYRRYGDGSDYVYDIFSGMYADDNLVFGHKMRVGFDLAGEMVSRKDIRGLTWQDDSFEYSIIHHSKRPIQPTHHIQFGSFRRRDVEFEFSWSTPLLMRVPYEIGGCLLDPMELPVLEDTIVPPAYIEVVDHPAWTPLSVTVQDSLPFSSDLPLPNIADPCILVGLEEGGQDLPQLLVKPTILDQGSVCSVDLRAEGSVELYDPAGRSLFRGSQISKFHEVHTNNLATGVYILRAIDTKGANMGVCRIVVR